MELVHGGLKGRILGSSSGPGFLRPGVSTENEILTVFDGTLAEAESGLNDVVRSFVAPVFALFDFAEFDDEVYDDLIAKFVAGRR